MSIDVFNRVVIGLLGNLTTRQRFEAMQQLDVGAESLFTNKWFVLMGWSLIIILVITLYVVYRTRLETEKHQVSHVFDEMADRLGITAAEREILDAITLRSGLQRKDAIFTHPDAFENGLARLMQDVFKDGHNLVYRKRLQAAVFSIKKKLDYVKEAPSESLHRIKEQSSRNIPVGKTVDLLTSSREDAQCIKADVIANDNYELVLLPEVPLSCPAGQVWLVRYEAGAVTWQFAAITLACSEKGLELNHTDRIRFVNRRRFSRVSVRKAGVIACIPIFRDIQEADDLRPIFFDAQVSEISGSGLRLQTELEVAVNDRVLVSFELEPGRILQDVGKIQDIRESPLGRVVIVELIGLNDKAVDELVRVTHQLASQAQKDAAQQGHTKKHAFAEAT